jgi:hypothetical protein
VNTHPQDRCPDFVREQGLLVLRHFRRDEAQDALRYGLRLGPGAQRLGRLLGDRNSRVFEQLVLDVAGVDVRLLGLQEQNLFVFIQAKPAYKSVIRSIVWKFEEDMQWSRSQTARCRCGLERFPAPGPTKNRISRLL